MELKDMCREVRKSLGLSQKKLAAEIGTNQTEVSFIERGFIPNDTQKADCIRRLFEQSCVVNAPL